MNPNTATDSYVYIASDDQIQKMDLDNGQTQQMKSEMQITNTQKFAQQSMKQTYISKEKYGSTIQSTKSKRKICGSSKCCGGGQCFQVPNIVQYGCGNLCGGGQVGSQLCGYMGGQTGQYQYFGNQFQGNGQKCNMNLQIQNYPWNSLQGFMGSSGYYGCPHFSYGCYFAIKDQIEAPWKVECQYLQQIIIELQQRKQNNFPLQQAQFVDGVLQTVDTMINELQTTAKNLIEQQNKQEEVELESGRNEDDMDELQQQIDKLTADLEAANLKNKQLSDNLENALNNNKKLNDSLQAANQQISQLNNELENARRRIKQLEDELQMSMSTNNQLNGELQKTRAEIIKQQRIIQEQEIEMARLRAEIDRLMREIQDWQLRYQELQNQGVTIVQEKVTFLTQEVEVWKQRFIKTNHEFNQCQEQLILAQAELESIKKGGERKEVVVMKTTVTKSSSNLRSSGQISSSGQLRSSGTEGK